MLMMIGSGWQIYDASPLFPFTFPSAITLGEWLAGALLWHFAAMWLLVVNGLVYVGLGLWTGRFRRKLLPLRPGEVITDARAALSGQLSHADLSVYNAVQKLLYLGVILCGDRDRAVGPLDVEADPAARAEPACSAATMRRVTCISSPCRRSSASSRSMC